MFKWPRTPSANADEHELADYAELVCWEQGSTSVMQLLKQLGRIAENDYSDGVPEEEETDEVVQATFTEMERREHACRGGYPFKIGKQGYTLHASKYAVSHKPIIYKYLLLATRLNMKDDRVQGGIDGTLLFEELAAESGREYFGNRAEKFIFGTSAEASDFRGKVSALCKQMKEGVRFVNRDDTSPNERDGKLDVVVWKAFTDSLPGKLIGFGQCKTGTYYRDTLTQLQPDVFCSKWLHSNPTVPPVRMFFVAEALPRSRWQSTSYDAGLLLDRCRIIDFCDEISSAVMEKVTDWTEAAARDMKFPGLKLESLR